MAAESGEMQVRISPEAAVLPANLLRVYVSFSRPGEAHFDRAQLRLRDGRGRDVADAFLVLSQELWSPDGRRLTVLLEPGRIKRGIGQGPNHAPALVTGETFCFELTVSGQAIVHRFRVAEPIMTPLDERRWHVGAPSAGSLDPVTISFDRVMDAPLCADEIRVVRPTGAWVPTRPSLTAEGTGLTLAPGEPWHDGRHDVVFSDRLEDVCGNRLGEALDHRLSEPGRPRSARLSFTPRPHAPAATRRPKP